jgi:hypothetical protein
MLMDGSASPVSHDEPEVAGPQSVLALTEAAASQVDGRSDEAQLRQPG